MSNANTVFSNLIWRFLERSGAQVITFIVSIIIARILEPKIYGTIALVSVFTSILQIFVDSGMGNALIQKKDADDLDFSSVFFFNIAACTLLYLIMFAAAPGISRFYGITELTPIIRILSLTLIISGVKNIQQAYVSRHMLFKKFFFSTLGGTLAAGIVGIAMALNGFGVWALVAQSLINSSVDTAILWATVGWRPKWMFSFERLKGLFSYGWKLLVSSLLYTGCRDLRALLIGKLYTPADLAFYNRGESLPGIIVNNIDISIDSVLLPALSAEQDKVDRVRSMTRRAIKTSTYLMMPLMAGLAACAVPVVRLVLTEKWLPCVFYLRIFCFSLAFYPLFTANLNAIKALGRSDIFLRLEIIKKAVELAALISTMFISVKAIAIGYLFTSIAYQFIDSWPNRKLLNYNYSDQIRDILPQICLSLFMGIMVYPITLLGLSDPVTLLIQIPFGAFLYITGSRLLHVDSYEYVLNMLKNKLK